MSKRTIYSRFQEMVNKFPENPAIVEDNRTISYSELTLGFRDLPDIMKYYGTEN